MTLSRRGHAAGMKITDEALNELVAIYEDEFREKMGRPEAIEMAHRLLTLYQLLAKKLPKHLDLSPGATQHDDDPYVSKSTAPVPNSFEKRCDDTFEL